MLPNSSAMEIMELVNKTPNFQSQAFFPKIGTSWPALTTITITKRRIKVLTFLHHQTFILPSNQMHHHPPNNSEAPSSNNMKDDTPKFITCNQQNTKKEKKEKGIAASSNSHDHQPSPLLALSTSHTLHNNSSIKVIPHPTFQLGLIHTKKKKPSHVQVAVDPWIFQWSHLKSEVPWGGTIRPRLAPHPLSVPSFPLPICYGILLQ